MPISRLAAGGLAVELGDDVNGDVWLLAAGAEGDTTVGQAFSYDEADAERTEGRVRR